ncbi:MAG TPA: MGMT family protein [Blastocatellia bacterium]|nr:MGMT family protein [Blastocatellia bacterium]
MSKTTTRKRAGDRESRRGRESRPLAPSPRLPGASFDKVFEKIYRLVLRIPRGRVMTYGQIARLLEERYSPRLVGWAMHATPHDERNIPWHRVINSRGGVSTGRVILAEPERQRLMLEAEGVVFDARGHCDLSVYQWSPRQRAARARLKALMGTKAGGRSKPATKAVTRVRATERKSRTRER